MMRFIKYDKIYVLYLNISMIETLIQYRCCTNNRFTGIEQVVPFLLSPRVHCATMNQSWQCGKVLA
jgi:hypothetical protein